MLTPSSPTPDPRDEFVVSRHVPEVIAFHSSASNRLISHSLYKKGRLILQDLASCFPAYVLNPPSEGSVQAIDATSAPGNKTSHLSAVMKGKGKVSCVRAFASYMVRVLAAD